VSVFDFLRDALTCELPARSPAAAAAGPCPACAPSPPGPAAGEGSMGTSFIPQIGQSPGLSVTYDGCIGQW
jgi:hypothetical protein